MPEGIRLRQVEATKFTEVGYHGRDVDQIIRDLVENAIVHTRARMKREIASSLSHAVEEKLLDLLTGSDGEAGDQTRESFRTLLREVSAAPARVSTLLCFAWRMADCGRVLGAFRGVLLGGRASWTTAPWSTRGPRPACPPPSTSAATTLRRFAR